MARGIDAKPLTSITMRPAGLPPMPMSKKTRGFAIFVRDADGLSKKREMCEFWSEEWQNFKHEGSEGIQESERRLFVKVLRTQLFQNPIGCFMA